MFTKSVRGRGGMICIGVLGLMLIFVNGVCATTEWRETTYNDFNDSDTISNLEIKAEGAQATGRVHLEDNNTESHDYSYSGANKTKFICHDDNANPKQLAAYSQSFYATIEGVVDYVEVMIYYIGDPIHTNEDQSTSGATVTISIEPVNQNTKMPSGGIPRSTRTVSYNFFPDQSGSWTTVWFSWSDSTGWSSPQYALDDNTYYALKIYSNADYDPNHQNEIRVEYKDGDTQNTECGKYHYDANGFPVWTLQGYDLPFKTAVHNFVTSGYLISSVHNTNNQATTLVKINWWSGGVAGTTSIHIYTRGGNTATPDETWSSWLEQTSYKESLNPSTPAPHGQYLQYKLELATNDYCFTPFFECVLIEYT